jgi:hypothetical protein
VVRHFLLGKQKSQGVPGELGVPGSANSVYLMESNSIWKHLGLSGKHLGGIWKHLAGIWEASGRDLGDLGSQGAPKVI